jgi:hypothetical protein
MLPKFSIAVSCLTITPLRAMRCAPRDSVMLMIAGSSSGAIPTASATAKSIESMTGLC